MTPQKLTACKDCMNHIPGGLDRNRCSATTENTFNAISGEYEVGRNQLCIKVNIDGHCPHFVEKI